MVHLSSILHRKDDLVLGGSGRSRFAQKFRISSKVRKFHTYKVGITKRGKSKFLQNCLVQDITAGCGHAVIDSHGDLAKDELSSLISQRLFSYEQVSEKVVYLAPRQRDYIVPFNSLARPDSQTETYEVAQRVIAAFMRT